MHKIVVMLAVAVMAVTGCCSKSGCCSKAGCPAAGRPLKVLAIGNSFSICTLANLPQVAQDLGVRLDLCSLYIPGCTLKRHWENVEKAETDTAYAPYIVCRSVEGRDALAGTPGEGKHKPGAWTGGYVCRYGNIPQMLVADAWDVVTIQQGSHESWQPACYHPYGDRLVETIRRLAPQAKVVVQQTWSYTPWDKRLKGWNLTPNEMYVRIASAYGDFAKQHGLEIIPTGMAIQLWRKELPVTYAPNSFGGDVVGGRWTAPEKRFKQENGAWKPSSDVFHLNEDGEYLQALVWAAKLFDRDVTGVTYAPKGLAPERAALMRKVAMEAVGR